MNGYTNKIFQLDSNIIKLIKYVLYLMLSFFNLILQCNYNNTDIYFYYYCFFSVAFHLEIGMGAAFGSFVPHLHVRFMRGCVAGDWPPSGVYFYIYRYVYARINGSIRTRQ